MSTQIIYRSSSFSNQAALAPKSYRALLIPELLFIIFSNLDQITNSVNAQVCKSWSEIALDVLWKKVDNLHQLFGILAPMNRDVDGDWTFTRLPDASDWHRFAPYRRRVRHLTYSTIHTSGSAHWQRRHRVHPSVFDDIARTRISYEILPNTHTLEWSATLSLSVLFMHANVKKFYCFLPPPLSEKSPAPFFLDIKERMTGLVHLDIGMELSVKEIEREMMDLLSGLKTLRRITLPRFTLTSQVAEALSQLPNLEVIEFQYDERQGKGELKDIFPFEPNLELGSFSSLWDLGVTLTVGDAAAFLDSTFAPTNLTSLFIDSHLIESPETMADLFRVLAENCQLLQALAVMTRVEASSDNVLITSTNVYGEQILDGERGVQVAKCLTYETFQPLLRLPKLTSLELVHHYPVLISHEEIESLALEWNNLEVLILNNEPAYLDHPTQLTLRSLIPFAQYCRNLRMLGLFINAEDDIPSSVPQSDMSPEEGSQYPIFQNLKRLSVGVSKIGPNKIEDIALFLAQVVPIGCILDSGITWDSSPNSSILSPLSSPTSSQPPISPDTDQSMELDALLSRPIHPFVIAEIESRCARWTRVGEMLPLLVKLRNDERMRGRRLRGEVEELRVRCGTLMDRERVSGVITRRDEEEVERLLMEDAPGNAQRQGGFSILRLLPFSF